MDARRAEEKIAQSISICSWMDPHAVAHFIMPTVEEIVADAVAAARQEERDRIDDVFDIAVAKERLREHKNTVALRAIKQAAEALVQSNPRFTEAPFQPWLDLLAALRAGGPTEAKPTGGVSA